MLLCGVALILLSGAALTRHVYLSETRRFIEETPKSWAQMDLRWEREGRQGQGIYAYSSKEMRPGCAADMSKIEGDESGLEEPRLAVFTSRRLDLNRIDFETLRVLKGVGSKTAAAIIRYREKHGPFRRIEELLEVKGIGPARFKVLRPSLAVETSGNP